VGTTFLVKYWLNITRNQIHGTRHEPFNFTPMAVNSISSGSPHVRPMGRTCGEPDEIKKNTHPKNFTALFREQVMCLVNLAFAAVRVTSSSNSHRWGPIRFRLALRTYAPWGCIVRVVPDRLTKSRQLPTRELLPRFPGCRPPT